MQFIIDFIDMIVATVSTIWNFFEELIHNFLLFFKYIAAVLVLCMDLIASMPMWLQIFGTITVTVSILYLLLGRTTGGQKE